VKKGPSEDQVMELALDAARKTWSVTRGGFEVRTEPGSGSRCTRRSGQVAVGLRASCILAEEHGPGPGETAEKVLRLVENLEDNDDVQHVYANFEISDEEMAAIESRVE